MFQEEVFLRGNLYFPNINLSQKSITFGCIPVNSEDYREVTMVNPTPLPATYSFAWDLDTIRVVQFDREVSILHCNIKRILLKILVGDDGENKLYTKAKITESNCIVFVHCPLMLLALNIF